MPSFSMASLIRSGWPSARTPGSVTSSARLTPRRLSSQPASAAAPGPNLIGVASRVKTVSWSDAAIPLSLLGATVDWRTACPRTPRRRGTPGRRSGAGPRLAGAAVRAAGVWPPSRAGDAGRHGTGPAHAREGPGRLDDRRRADDRSAGLLPGDPVPRGRRGVRPQPDQGGRLAPHRRAAGPRGPRAGGLSAMAPERTDPTQAQPQPPFPAQEQEPPGYEDQMRPRADH